MFENTQDWYFEELDYADMREVRRGFYESRGSKDEFSLERSRSFIFGLIIRRAGFKNLGEGLLHLRFMFPYGSETQDPYYRPPVKDDDEDDEDWD